jgi:hypothetical protein
VASKYQRVGSQYWWLKFRDESGAIVRQATKYRIGVGVETRACERHVAQLTVEEKNPGLIYQRFSVDDLSACVTAIGVHTSSEGNTPGPYFLLVFFETRAISSSNRESKSFRIADLFDFL